MLPSMPLILSTPCKEVLNEELVPSEGCSDDHNQVSTKALDLSITAKKSSPMKHVTPILKKYNCHRKGKGGKKMGLLCDQPQCPEKQLLRPIAPKPVMVLVTPSSEDGTVKDINEITSVKHDITDTNDSKKAEEDKKEERKDNEDELAALMLASTTIKSKGRTSNVVKKRTKQVRDMEASVALLTPDGPLVREEKSYGFAQAYFLKVKERLEGTELYHAFLHTMNEFGTSIIEVTDLYQKVTALLSQHPDLSEEFLAFLLPEQAMQCGKLMEYLMITKMRDFFRRLEIYFEKQPQQMRKFYSALTTLCAQANVTVSDVRTAILPLLKGNSLLVDNFLNLLPDEKPPESMMTEFEELDFGDKDCKRLGEDDMFETVVVPNQQDAFGGDGCACNCHNSRDDKYCNRAAHCLSCGTRFIHGKIFLQTGKVLRPAKVAFDTENSNESINRLSAKNRPRARNHKRTTIKFGNSPLKHAHIIFGNSEGAVSPKGSRACKTKTAQKSRVPKSCRQLVKTKSRSTSRSGRQPSARSTTKSSNRNSQSRVSSVTNSQVAGTTSSLKNSVACTALPITVPSSVLSVHTSPDAIPLDESAILPPVVGSTNSNMTDFSSLSHALQNALDETRTKNVNQSSEHTNVVFQESLETASCMGVLNSISEVSKSPRSEHRGGTSQLDNLVTPSASRPEQSLVENFNSLSQVLQCTQEVSSKDGPVDNISIDKSGFAFSSNSKVLESKTKSFDSLSDILQSNESSDAEKKVEMMEQEEKEEEDEVLAEGEEGITPLPLETCLFTSDDVNECHLLSQKESNVDQLNEVMEISLGENKNSDFHPDSNDAHIGDENYSKPLEEKIVNSAWTREEDKIILQMYKLEHSFQEISEHLPQRSVEEIKSRFEILINIVKQMTEQKMDEDSNSTAT